MTTLLPWESPHADVLCHLVTTTPQSIPFHMKEPYTKDKPPTEGCFLSAAVIQLFFIQVCDLQQTIPSCTLHQFLTNSKIINRYY